MKIDNKCPKCGGDILYDDVLDTEFCEGKYLDTVVGHCEKCGQDYMWQDVFRYVRTENLHEDN